MAGLILEEEVGPEIEDRNEVGGLPADGLQCAVLGVRMEREDEGFGGARGGHVAELDMAAALPVDSVSEGVEDGKDLTA